MIASTGWSGTVPARSKARMATDIEPPTVGSVSTTRTHTVPWSVAGTGTTVVVQNQWIEGEGESFRASMAPFEAATGIDIQVAEVPSGFHETQVNVGLNGGNAADSVTEAMNYDNGSEENEAPGSGFDGGQPDPSRGAENVENGTPTDPQEPVTAHDQITDTVLELTVSAQ